MSAGADAGAGDRSLDFAQITPSRFVSFTFPNPSPEAPNSYGDPLRVAVLDSPLSPPPTHQPPRTAAMLVPLGWEDDWIFSTTAGHLHLLLSSSPSFARLVLIGSAPSTRPYSRPYNKPDSNPDWDSFQTALLPLLLALSPKAAFNDSIPDIPFLSFEDSALRINSIEVLTGPIVGEMLVEDVAIEMPPPALPEIRRRLRFKRMPNLVQSQVRLLPDPENPASFQPELGSLVQPYLGAMVAGFALIGSSMHERIASGIRPRSLCVGVGGGALLLCLKLQLGFEVIGLESDPVVVDVATKHFGLIQDELLCIHICEAIEFIKRVSYNSSFYDAILVDLDTGDAVSGVSAPPLEFIEKSVLLAVRSILCESGVLVMNVIPPPLDGSFHKGLVDVFGEVFSELYRIGVEDSDNFVLAATASPVPIKLSESRGEFIGKLKQLVGESLIHSLEKV